MQLIRDIVGLPLALPVVLVAAAPVTVLAAPASDSAYLTDPQTSYVQDATSESIGQVNMITCIMHAMRPDALVNQAPYIALIDKNVCDSQKSSLATSGSSAAQAPDYLTAVVKATRASNSDPMITHAWISIDEEGKAVTVYANVSATEAPSAANPYGAFRIDYCGKAAGIDGCVMNGFMVGGNGTLSYYEIDNGGGGGEITALQLTSVGTTSGSGSLNLHDPGNGDSAFNFAYNSNYFLRADDQNNTQCFNRDATDPDTGMSVWQYGLYDASTGARVDRNAGFPIQYTANGTTYQGYLGYYGMSLPSDASISSGATLQKVDYSSDDTPQTTNYAVVINGGRLTRFTKKTRTLKDIDQIHFNAFLNNVSGSGLPDSNTQYDMYWDDASGKFIATGEMQCSPGGCQTSALTSNVSVDPAFFVSTGGVQGWSQSLGGDMFVSLSGVTGAINASTSANIVVAYHVQDMVYPDDTNKPTALYCAAGCPTAGTLEAYFNQTGNSLQSPFVATTANNQALLAQDLVSYSVSSDAMLAGGDGSSTPVVYTNPEGYDHYQQWQGGVNSGHLFVNLADAACFSNQYCDWAVNGAAVYYQWQTGPNTFNQFSAVKDGNNQFVHFDAPLDVSFHVPAGARYGSYANTNLVLQYNNFGNLNGIPGTCVSATTNQVVNCGPGSRYVPQFVIPYDPTATPQQGVVTSSSNGTTTTYLVKWLQREIRFAQKSPSVCSTAGLAAPTNVTLPTQAQLKDPSDSSSDAYLGVMPTVTGAPRVVQGDVKY